MFYSLSSTRTEQNEKEDTSKSIAHYSVKSNGKRIVWTINIIIESIINYSSHRINYKNEQWRGIIILSSGFICKERERENIGWQRILINPKYLLKQNDSTRSNPIHYKTLFFLTKNGSKNKKSSSHWAISVKQGKGWLPSANNAQCFSLIKNEPAAKLNK